MSASMSKPVRFPRRKPFVAFTGSALVSLVLAVPTSASAAKQLPTAPPAITHSAAGASRVSSEIGSANTLDPISWKWSYTTNNNASARCRQKQSYIKADYSGNYLVYLKMSHSWVSGYKYFEDWPRYWNDAQTVWTASLLAPTYSHREDYIYTLGPYVNQTREPAMIAFSVYDRNTKEQLAVYFSDMRIGCGRDYQITIWDV